MANVKVTRNYAEFKFINNNREPVRGHIEALKEAMDDGGGNFTEIQPVLVNDRMEIVDGQHRLLACQEMGLPIYYTQVTGLGIHEARQMNILHRKWDVSDFAQSYAKGGDPNYQKYLVLREDYGFNHGITLNYIYNSEMQGLYAAFRNGDFVLEDEAGARERLDKLAQVDEVTGLGKFKPLALALLKLMNNEQYDHKHMLNKLRRHQEMVRKYDNLGDNARMLEEIYNKQSREENRVRLY